MSARDYHEGYEDLLDEIDAPCTCYDDGVMSVYDPHCRRHRREISPLVEMSLLQDEHDLGGFDP